MNDYVVPKEVIEWAILEAQYPNEEGSDYETGYTEAVQTFLKKINVVFTKDKE